MKSANVHVEGPLLEQSKVCEKVLRALPKWFGIESATLNYIQSADVLPSFVARVGAEAVGIALVKQHFERGAEVFLIGVLPDHHRHGAGRALIEAMQSWLARRGVEFLQVKTLSPGRVDANYDKTRAFYLGIGFVPLEEFPTLWDPSNPCLMLVKHIAPAPAAD